MKKLSFFLSYALIAFSVLMFQSCDDDIDRAMILSGSWRGDFGMCYYYPYHGKELQFNSYDTYIVFYPDHEYATHGYGKQVDYYDEGPYERRYYRFDWDVRNDVIYLTYPHDPELDTAIYEYRLDLDFFSGYFCNANERFRLHKLSDFYDWNYYRNDWYYYEWYDDDWYDDRYYAPTKAGAENDAPIRNARRTSGLKQ